jgi:hypothetical protein
VVGRRQIVQIAVTAGFVFVAVRVLHHARGRFSVARYLECMRAVEPL